MEVSSFYGRRRNIVSRKIVTLSEGLEAASSTEKPIALVILPPSSGDANIPSDTEEVPDMNDDTPFETAGEVELEEEQETSDSSEDDVVQDAAPARKRKRENPLWKRTGEFDDELSHSTKSPFVEQFPLLKRMTAYEIWKLIMTDEIVENIRQQTELYAHRDRNDQEFSVTFGELLRFFGILVFSGYHAVPQEAHYWSNQPDLGVSAVSEVMSSKRYYEIKQALHLADNANLQQGNKAAKVQPLYDALNSSFVQFGVFHENVSIDESMIPYYGHHSVKMFIKAKPIRFGYKIWTLAGVDGYPYHLKIYTGKDGDRSEPLGTRVVNHMVNVIKVNSDVKYHQIFFDNFFTSYQLLRELSLQQVRATGTVREHRTGGAHHKLVPSAAMKKKERGSFDYVSDGTVFVCKWHDNSVVCVASNYLNHEPVHTATRRVKQQPSASVKQPFLIRKYNESMGGVDLTDRLLASYRPTIRGKKWWWPLFTNALNVSIVAAWRIHCALHGGKDQLDHLAFRRQVVLCLLKAGTDLKPRLQVGGGRLADLPDDIRYDGLEHDRQPCSQGRCKLCQKNCRVQCCKCNVRLHADHGKKCFLLYHTRSD